MGAALVEGFNILQSATGRPSLPQVMITIIATASSDIDETVANAQSIRDNNIYSIVIRLGPVPDEAEVKAVATDPRAVLTYNSAQHWSDAVDSTAADELLGKICPAGKNRKTILRYQYQKALQFFNISSLASQNLVTLIFDKTTFSATLEYQPYGAHFVKFSYL